MLDLTPAASEEIVDISLSALTVDDGTGTTEDPGSSTDETDTSTDNNSENGSLNRSDCGRLSGIHPLANRWLGSIHNPLCAH